MTDSVKLRIILGENNSEKLILPSGIPESVDDLKFQIKRQCAVTEDFRLQYLDVDFNEFVNLTTTADIKHLSTVKLITNAPTVDLTTAVTLSSASEDHGDLQIPRTLSEDSVSLSSADTEILSSQESASSTSSTPSNSSLRTQAWPAHFLIPEFTYEAELQLRKGNEEFHKNGTYLDPSTKLKSAILEALSTEILKFKAYPTGPEFDSVAEALIKKHPCLKEQGSVCGFYGWKISLKYKMANCRSSLRHTTSELLINSVKRRQGDTRTGPNQVKKPRRAEVNFLPDYPTGENEVSLENERQVLLSEVTKRDNDQVIKVKMERTFALRRHEIVHDMPFIAEFKSRWPALFSDREICAEFTRITTIPLKSKFMAELDIICSKLPTVCRRKGGEAGNKIKDIMASIRQNHTAATTRAGSMKALVLYLNEDPELLIKEYLDVNFDDAQRQMEQTTLGIYVITREGADATDSTEDIGILVEGVTVLSNIEDVSSAIALLFGIVYVLNLSYPRKLRYTFEFIQKVLMGIDNRRLSDKVQVLKNKLSC